MGVKAMNGSTTRVVVLEDQQLMREILLGALSNQGFEVACAGDPTAFYELVERHSPHVAIVDLTFDFDRPTPPGDGFAVLRQMREAHPSVRLLVFSAATSQSAIDTAFLLGTHGYLFKSSATVASLRQAIAQLLAGERVLPRDFTVPREPPKQVDRAAGPGAVKLTDRERQVLDLVGSGANNVVIAGRLQIKERTVKAHVSSLYRKLGSENRVELALLANNAPRMSDK